MTLPGPFTMTQQAQNDYYAEAGDLALAYAAAVNEEMKDLFAAGVDIVQLDEPYVQARPEAAREYAVAAIDRALDGATGTTALHVCFGYGKHVANKPKGYAFCEELDACARGRHLARMRAAARRPRTAANCCHRSAFTSACSTCATAPIETPDSSRSGSEQRCEHAPPERLVVAPDCGMKYLPRDVAYGKLVAMVRGRDIVRGELT